MQNEEEKEEIEWEDTPEDDVDWDVDDDNPEK